MAVLIRKSLSLTTALCAAALLGACQINPAAVQTEPNHIERPSDFFALCYHDVRDDVKGDLDKDQGAVNTEHLAQHFDWLQQQGYTPVSLDEIEAARAGEKPLPPKAVLLTFDDGYDSFYYKIYPLLKLYNYPAVFALVTDWIETPDGEKVPYGDELKDRREFLHWDQVREMQASGLVEIASHTHNLHRGITSNPQGNIQAAALTRQYSNGRYESEADYRQRLYRDFKLSADLIEQNTEQRPRTLVWPYGRYSDEAWAQAQKAGYQHSLVLEQGENVLNDGPHINRYLISANPTPTQFRDIFQAPQLRQPQRVVHVDLDYLYDPDPAQQHQNLSALVRRIYKMEINTVYLQAFADPDGDGNAQALYFPNRHLPMRADLYSRVSWQLKTRANVDVYAWMPVSAFDLGDETYRELGVYSMANGEIAPAQANYRRLSIFAPEAKKIIKDIYADLAIHAEIPGLIFHDDAYLSDYEDVRPEALDYYRQHGLQFDSPQALRRDAATLSQWAKIKTQALTDFTLELAEVVEHYRPDVKLARNLYARPVLQPSSEQWFAQNLDNAVEHYDTTAIMAMPYMEGARSAGEAEQWLASLMDAVEASKLPKHKILFELQAKQWHKDNAPVPAEELARQMQAFKARGFQNYGYYPDDFIAGQPEMDIIRPHLSTTDYPHMRR
ncbi:YcdR [gamma proteobacterium HTCC5015]|nr:YcdR [gamma proteobacterium HTCC5015]